MRPKIPMTDEEIRMHKPVSPDFVDFRAGIRCAERVYQVADLYSRIAELEAELMAQARVNGMGGEREAKLMARVERLERVCDVALEALETNRWSVANLAPHEDVEAYTAAINMLKEVRRD